MLKASGLNIPQGKNIYKKLFSVEHMIWHKHISRTLRNKRWYAIFPPNFNCKWHFLSRDRRLIGRVLCCRKGSVCDLRSGAEWGVCLECQWSQSQCCSIYLLSPEHTSPLLSASYFLLKCNHTPQNTLFFFSVFLSIVHCLSHFEGIFLPEVVCIFICAGAWEVERLSKPRCQPWNSDWREFILASQRATSGSHSS